ncbi:DUF5074 domain-containing protein [Chitinophagaceae bacterium MMS25-I14]
MDRKSIKIVILALCWICLLAACKKGDSGNCCTLPTSDTSAKVYIICEGALSNGNSSLCLYLPAKDSVYEDVYKAANGQSVGDVFQSMTAIGNYYFLCINNSDKILVINKSDWKLQGTINVSKPRYILPISATKAYVSSLFSNKVNIIDPSTLQATGSFSMPFQNTEGLFLLNDSAFICTWDTATNNLYSINTTTNQPTHSFTMAGYAPQEILMDKEQKLWVLSGNITKGKPAAFTRFDPATGQILKAYNFTTTSDVIKPVFNPTKDTIYFIEVDYNGGTANNGIYRMGIHDAALPAQPFVATQQYQYFWALGIDPRNGNIYVGDPKGFTQKGVVTVYRPDASIITTFKTGLGPGHFYFD